MPRGVVLSQGAEDDLESLHGYLARNRSVQEASDLLDALVEKCASLASFSLRGSVPLELADLGIDDFRQVLLGPYRIVYFLADETVVVSLIADGRRDMQALLRRRLLNP